MSLFWGPIATIGAVTAVLEGRPKNVADWLILTAFEELCVAIALYCGCGIIWAVATPRRMEKLAEPVGKRLVIALAVVLVPFAALVLLNLVPEMKAAITGWPDSDHD